MESMRVLVVDDESELLEALVERLNLRGIEAVGETQGADAVDRVRSERFDVLLVDVKMPAPDGLTVLREVKALRPELPVVLLTGHGAVSAAEEGKRLGASDFVMKPVSIEILMEILRRASAGGAEGDG
jgi:two-component system OmpR family response regulator